VLEQSRASVGVRILEQVDNLQARRQKHPRPNLLTPYVSPRSDVEKSIVDLWQGALGLTEIGIHDNFFDLGGDSLLATLLIGRIGETFNIALSLRALFEAPTVAEMAVTIIQRRAAQMDTETLTELLQEIKNLTPDELQSLIAKEQVQR
jgi:acyl carrier protein